MTDAEVQKLLKHPVAKGRFNLPSRDARGRLAVLIYGWGVEARQLDASRRDLAQCFDGILAQIPVLIEELRAEESAPANLLRGPDWRRMEEDCAALNRLIDAIKGVQSREFFQRRSPLRTPPLGRKGGARWHHYANTLAAEFTKALRQANPGVEIKLGDDDNPVTRFVAAVIPLITGERVKQPAINRHLHPRKTH